MRWVESWEVESRSKPGEYYTVSRDEEGNFGCSCLAWTRQRRECRHIRLMKGQLRLGGSHEVTFGPGTILAQTEVRGGPVRVAKDNPTITESPEPRKRRRYVLD